MLPDLLNMESKPLADIPSRVVALAVRVLAVSMLVIALAGCQQQMASQPYYKPQDASELFADGQAMRPLVAGTVFRGDLRENDALWTGKVNGQNVDKFPISITQEVLERGQQRYNIFCSPCHGRLGDGNGMVVQRGVSAPPSYTDDRLLTAPVGHFYDVISNGWGRMYSYDHIPVRDRWAIIAYVKALQLSQKASIEDVPEEKRAELQQLPNDSPALRGIIQNVAVNPVTGVQPGHEAVGGAH